MNKNSGSVHLSVHINKFVGFHHTLNSRSKVKAHVWGQGQNATERLITSQLSLSVINNYYCLCSCMVASVCPCIRLSIWCHPDTPPPKKWSSKKKKKCINENFKIAWSPQGFEPTTCHSLSEISTTPLWGHMEINVSSISKLFYKTVVWQGSGKRHDAGGACILGCF